MTCERLRAEAVGLAALPRGDPDREAAWAHAGGCPDCAAALRAAERLHAALRQLAPPAASPAGALDPALTVIASELRRETRRKILLAAVAVCVAFVVAVALARQRSRSIADASLTFGLAAAALAAAAGAAWRRSALAVAIAGPALIAAVALATGGPGGSGGRVGIDCVVTELACGAIVVAASWAALRGGTTVFGARTAAATAAAGALAGAAALELTCSVHRALSHLVTFHVAGVLAAVLAAAVIVRAAKPSARLDH